MDLSKYMAKPDKSLEEHISGLLEQLELLYRLGYLRDEHLYELVAIACEYHDDGKVNALFQQRVREHLKKIRFDKEKEVCHNVLSPYFLNPESFVTLESYYSVFFAILYHHNYGNSYETFRETQTLSAELLQDFDTFPVNKETLSNVNLCAEKMETIKVKGFLHKCDYSASGQYTCEYPNDFLVSSMEHVKEEWKHRNPNSDWNALQRFCMDAQDQNIIITASTGMGKTEAGLHWIGNHKGFFVLPLRTAINAVYDRVRIQILQNRNLEERLAILHSESLEYYARTLKEEEIDIYSYYVKGKQMSVPLCISTMDQLFDFVFKYQGYELKLTTLSYSRVVIDEIQMYSPDVLAYLIWGLERIAEAGGKIAVMTATLSPFLKYLLQRNIPFAEEQCKVFIDDSVRHNICVKQEAINGEDILNQYRSNEQQYKSNKILVICNTISDAQRMYQEVGRLAKESEGEVPVSLLHSRYTRRERAEREREILEFGITFDRDNVLDEQSGIWISTSLVEASLDIDFDYLFTELQDLNSFFQRLGRCNRKGVKSVEEYNCFVYTKIGQTQFWTSSHGFIDETIFSLSKEALLMIDGPLPEAKKLELINNFLTVENLKKSKYYKEFRKEYEYIQEIECYKFEPKEMKLRNILSETIIPSPVFDKEKERILEWERILKEDNLTVVNRVKVKEKIMQYTVSVPQWQWFSYKAAAKHGKADAYEPISIGSKQSIPVMECQYDEQGYRFEKYEEKIREPEFL